jgi:hypothetical protein
VGLRTLLFALTVVLGVVANSAAQAPCRRIGEKGTPTSGIEEVCEKPANRKSWGQLLADYIGYKGYSKSHALLVGISNYTGGYDNLPTRNDALKMRDFLMNEAGFDYVHVLTDGHATIDRIRELMIDVFPERIDKNDRFLFYWSGHGVTRGTSGFLPVSDTLRGHYSKMISMDNIQLWDGYLKARQSLFLLDACFGGLAGSVAKSPTTDLTVEQLAQRSHHLLTAGTDEEETIAGDRWNGSLFTAAVIDGLRGEADTASRFGRDGVVSLHELIGYVQTRVAVEKQRVGWKGSLTPQLRDLRTNIGEFFFLTTERKWTTIRERGLEPTGASTFGEPVVKSSAGAVPTRTPELVREAQEVLTALGYRPGPVDGKLGIRTRGALLQFQKDTGLAPTGKLDEPTINRLAESWGGQRGRGVLNGKGKVTRGWLGVTIQNLSPELARSFGLEDAHGALVASVHPNGPAAKAGIESGDVIVTFQGKTVEDANDLPRMVAVVPPATKVDIEIIRGGKRRTISVVLGAMKDEEQEGGASARLQPSDVEETLGLRVQAITPDVARALRLEDTDGVVVSQMEPDGPAAEAGVRRGDVVREINRKSVTDLESYEDATGHLDPQVPVLFLLERQGNELYLALKPRKTG